MFLKRNKAAAISAFLVALVCLVIGISVVVFTTRNQTIQSLAVLPFVNAGHNPDMGEKKQALEMLEKAYQAREHTLAQIKVNPELDSLRSDSRFDELLQRMNLNH